MMNQPTKERVARLAIPDGQERLATQYERDEVKRTLEAPPLLRRASPGLLANDQQHPVRGSGDQVNRFLLCALVKESARLLRENARRDGNSLPMSKIVRGVLRSYLTAAADRNGPLAGSMYDLCGLQRLNDRVLQDETARHAQDRVSAGKVRLALAERLGDESRIQNEKSELDLAIESRDRLASTRGTA